MDEELSAAERKDASKALAILAEAGYKSVSHCFLSKRGSANTPGIQIWKGPVTLSWRCWPLFVLTRKPTSDKDRVLEELKGLGGKIFMTSLSHEDEARLGAALNATKSTDPLIINRCAHPDYRDELQRYLDIAKENRSPESLTNAFALHRRFLEAGDMRRSPN